MHYSWGQEAITVYECLLCSVSFFVSKTFYCTELIDHVLCVYILAGLSLYNLLGPPVCILM